MRIRQLFSRIIPAVVLALSACTMLVLGQHSPNLVVPTAAVASAKNLHTATVELVQKESIDLDAPIPPDLQQSFPEATTRTFYVKGPGSSVPVKKALTVRQVLSDTEDTLKASGLKVHLQVAAAPDNCSVNYVPVVGGPSLDGGQTNTSLVVDPKYYAFTCTCHGKTIRQVIDGTSDRTITFSCSS